MNLLERIFESAIWKARFVVVIAVVASLVASLAMFFMATVDTVITVKHLAGYASPELTDAARRALRLTTVAHVVEIVDGYLLASVLLIFALGLYELFVSRIDAAAGDGARGNVLFIRSLDDLKNRLAKVILMILIVTFFERVLTVDFARALDLLYLAVGIALIGLALYLTKGGEEGHGPHAEPGGRGPPGPEAP